MQSSKRDIGYQESNINITHKALQKLIYSQCYAFYVVELTHHMDIFKL